VPPARTSQLELLDTLDRGVPAPELAGNLRDIRRANRWFGGTRAVVRGIRDSGLGNRGAAGRPVTILDLATGSADIPLAIAELARREGWRVAVTATDVQPAVLAVARAAERPGLLRVEAADARDLPYADASFDVVTLSLALHHFEPDDAARVLREMRRVGRQLIVNDLERSRPGLAAAWLFAHLLTRNRLTRHDAPLSVRRAYTPAEALALARAAGWNAARVRRAQPFRFVLTGTS
jgi:SAM-dependent methyltransferase